MKRQLPCCALCNAEVFSQTLFVNQQITDYRKKLLRTPIKIDSSKLLLSCIWAFIDHLIKWCSWFVCFKTYIRLLITYRVNLSTHRIIRITAHFQRAHSDLDTFHQAPLHFTYHTSVVWQTALVVIRWEWPLIFVIWAQTSLHLQWVSFLMGTQGQY